MNHLVAHVSIGRRTALIALCLTWIALLTGCKSYPAMEEAQSALESTDQLRVETDKHGIHFIPAQPTSDLGIILYPGASIAPESYAPMMRALAEQGMIAVISRFPSNLAILAPNRATQISSKYDEQVNRWILGGHSLGGAMATRFIKSQGPVPDQFPALFLLAAYPSAADSISDYGLHALSLSASEDGLTSAAEIDTSRLRLPPHTQFITIEGGNHAQFGWYGEQEKDNPALISREQQQTQILNALDDLIQRVR